MLKEVKHIFILKTKLNISDSQRVLEMEFSGDAILYLLDTYVLPRARVVTLQHWALPRGTSWSNNFDMKNLIPCRCAKVCSRLLETSTQELLFVALCLVLCIISSFVWVNSKFKESCFKCFARERLQELLNSLLGEMIQFDYIIIYTFRPD